MKRVEKISVLAAATLCCQLTFGQLSYPIVDTGQSTFYDNSREIAAPAKGSSFFGQDAQYQGNSPSYKDNGDGTITDNVTGLVWQKGYQVMSYDDAIAAAEHFTLAGHSDWRLPTIKEAYSLILFSGVDASSRDMNSVPAGAIPFIDTNYFDFKYGSNGTRSIDTQILSSTTYVGTTATARMRLVFGVNIADGRIKGYPISTRGQGKSYTVRFVRGAVYGVNSFVANKDKTISDNATGLMWQRDDSGKGMNWQEALAYVAKMNSKSYLGYSDWRLPNVKELQSIVDYTRSPESTSSAAIDPLFNVTAIKNEMGERDYPFYWSSTTHCSVGLRGGGGSAASYVSFGRGLGNMSQMQQGAQGGGSRGSNGGGRMGQRQGVMQQREQRPTEVNENWINIHGAGCQRSDPKSGDAAQYSHGRGPQGDAIRIANYVRLVRDL